jgi:hypothetical protein
VSRRIRFGLLVCLSTAGLALGPGGCNKSESVVKVKGKILKNGLPYQPKTEGLPPGDRGVKMNFIRLGGDKAGEEYPVTVDANGNFEAIGLEGKGIPPGKYRITIHEGPFGMPDQLKEKFNKENSKIEREVKPGGGDLVIDLDKPEG